MTELAEQVPDQTLQTLEEPEELTYHDIELLQGVGVSMSDVGKLKDAGHGTIRSLQCAMSKELCKIKGFSEAKVDKIKTAASKIMNPGAFISSRAELERRKTQCFSITTGSTELDKLLGGGIEAQSITEIHGEFRTGKTQICLTMCVTAQMPNEATGYTGGRVVYIDTEGTFRPERLEPICERYGVDYGAALENVLFCQALNSEHQDQLLDTLSGVMCEQEGCIKLIIVDSIMCHFRTDYQGRGELQARQMALGQFLKKLYRMSRDFNCAVLVTNQMTSDPSGGMTFVADPKKPVGGHVLAHAVHTRLSLRKGSGSDRIAKLVDSTTLPEGDATFAITPGGVADSS